jgi:hypothetical protein
MGSWSVACGISNIAITSGDDCVILPLKENKGGHYHKYQPATLPIFGEYNDYGGMENIIEDDNTKLIEEHFGVTIDEFVEFLVDGQFTYEREEATEIGEKMKNFEQAKEWRFMWINRKVYETMLIDVDKWDKGHNDYGTPEMLKLFGFEQVPDAVCKNYDAKRFNQLWENKDGVKFYSDGRSLLAYGDSKGCYVYHFGHGDDSSIETYFEVPKELEYLKGINKMRTWRLMDQSKRNEEFGWVLGSRYEFDSHTLKMNMLIEKIYDTLLDKKPDELTEEDKLALEKVKIDVEKQKADAKKNMPFHRNYYADFETWGDRIVDLLQLIKNLHPMSHQLLPHTLYLTPQCGEHEAHQFFLNRFAEINYEHLCKYEVNPDNFKYRRYTETELRQAYQSAWELGRANYSTNIDETIKKLNNFENEKVA